MSKSALGSGQRFAALKSELATQPGVRDPGALAASIGRKKFGAEKMAQMSAAGRRGGTRLARRFRKAAGY